MRRAFIFVMLVQLLLSSSLAVAGELDYSKLPERAQTYIPMLLEQIDEFWPDMDEPSIFCALIETETCITLKHRYCWSPTATLKTSREEGRGLGQITRAWDSRGNLRFDSLQELRNKHQEALAGWSWKNVGEALFQLRGIVLMYQDLYTTFDFAETEVDRFCFTDASYNGGRAGLMSDRALCAATPGCNPNVWPGNVENTSKKARTAANGYGKGFFYINREHVDGVVFGLQQGRKDTRRARYQKAGLQ